LERLPQTVTEVNSIADLFKKAHLSAEVRLGESATKKNLLLTDLTRFQFVHFATHGIVPTTGKMREPALVFSYSGSDIKQALLPISQIVDLRLDAEMVTLSACNTGSGKISRAEGVMNLGRAFLLAGAKDVTVSLWSVSDESTSLLMQEFYKNLQQGKSKPEALAAARTALRSQRKFEDPYFWGAFIVVGE
jgi:CHAT domain-containing protein